MISDLSLDIMARPASRQVAVTKTCLEDMKSWMSERIGVLTKKEFLKDFLNLSTYKGYLDSNVVYLCLFGGTDSWRFTTTKMLCINVDHVESWISRKDAIQPSSFARLWRLSLAWSQKTTSFSWGWWSDGHSKWNRRGIDWCWTVENQTSSAAERSKVMRCHETRSKAMMNIE